MKSDAIIPATIMILSIMVIIYKQLTRQKSRQTQVVRRSLDLLEVIKLIHCHSIQILGYERPQRNCALLLKGINCSTRESYYWTENKIEISAPFFNVLKSTFPNQFNGQPIVDEDLKPILTLIIANGFLESLNPQYNNGFNYRYLYFPAQKKISDEEAEKKYKTILHEIKTYKEICGELNILDKKWQIKKYLQAVIANNWVPKKYWH